MPKKPEAKNETGQLVGKGGSFLSVGITAEQRKGLDELSKLGFSTSKIIRALVDDFLATPKDELLSKLSRLMNRG